MHHPGLMFNGHEVLHWYDAYEPGNSFEEGLDNGIHEIFEEVYTLNA